MDVMQFVEKHLMLLIVATSISLVLMITVSLWWFFRKPKKEEVVENNKIQKKELRKMQKIWRLFLILWTGEVPVDAKNPTKSKDEFEKEIREVDRRRIELENDAKIETDDKEKKKILSKASAEREKFFDLKYKLLDNGQKNERKVFWRIVAIIYSIFFIIEVYLSFHNLSILNGKIEVNIGLLLFISQVLYTIASLRQVSETEIAALSFLSKFILNIDSGIAFVPVGFCRISTVTKNIIVQELPDDAENIYEPKDKESAPEGKSLPMFIICGYPKVEKKDDPLKDDPLNARLTGRATPVVTYRVINPRDFFSYVGSLIEARGRMTDVASAMLGTEIAQTTYSEVIENMAKYNRLLSMAITRKIDGYSEVSSKPWGLHFEDAWLKPFLFGHELHKSMAKLVEAKFNKTATIINAEANKQSVVLAGEATASVIKNEEDALTESLLKRKKNLEIDSELIFNGEIAKQVAKDNTVLVGARGFTEILAIAETLKTAKEGGD